MQPGTTPVVAWTTFASLLATAIFIVLRKFFGLEFVENELVTLKDLLQCMLVWLAGYLAPDAKRKDAWTPELRTAVEAFVEQWKKEHPNG